MSNTSGRLRPRTQGQWHIYAMYVLICLSILLKGQIPQSLRDLPKRCVPDPSLIGPSLGKLAGVIKSGRAVALHNRTKWMLAFVLFLGFENL